MTLKVKSVSFDDAKISDLSSDNKYEKERTSKIITMATILTMKIL